MVLNMLNKLPIFIILLIWAASLHAKERGIHKVKEKVGQEYYLAACSSCHGNGNIAGNMASHREWRALLGNKASELIYLHEDVYTKQKDKDATVAIAYLKSEKFTKEKRKLLKSLQAFANDSESIPTCY